MAKFHRDDDRDEPGRPAASGGSTAILVVLAAVGGVMVLVCAGGFAAMWLFTARAVVREEAVIQQEVTRLEEERAAEAMAPEVAPPEHPDDGAPGGAGRAAADGGPLKASRDNLRRIGLAAHDYESAHSYFPNNVYSKDGKPLLSWRVQLLPSLGEDKLYREFKLDEPWDGEHNKTLIAKMPKLYAPVRVKAEPGHTFYRGFAGPGTMFEPNMKVTITGATDGTSNTAWVVEAGQPVVWTKPDDLPFDPKKDLPKLGGLFDGEFHVLTADAQVHLIRKDFDPRVFKAMVTRSGGEVIDLKTLKK